MGFYRAFPELLAKANIDINDVVAWEDEVEVRLPDGRGNGVFGASPLFNPVGTVLGVLSNWHILSALDRISLAGFFSAGLLQYFGIPGFLDRRNVRGMAECFGVTEDAIRNLLVPLTSSLYFRPPERYSAYAFFGTFGPYMTRLWSLRIGAFRGGMTEIMAARTGDAIQSRGGEVRTRIAPRRCGARDTARLAATVVSEATCTHGQAMFRGETLVPCRFGAVLSPPWLRLIADSISDAYVPTAEDADFLHDLRGDERSAVVIHEYPCGRPRDQSVPAIVLSSRSSGFV